MIKLIFAISLIIFTQAYQLDTYDSTSMYHYISSSLQLLANDIVKNFNDTQVINTEHHMFFITKKLKEFTVNFKPPTKVSIEGLNIIYEFGNIFNISLEATYIWTLGVIPLTGSCVLNLAPKKTIVNIKIDKKITAGCKITEEMSVSNITNSIAVAIGVKKQLEAATVDVGSFFKTLVNNSFGNYTDSFFQEIFENKTQTISFSFKGSPKIRLRTIRKSFAIEKNDERMEVHTNYQHEMSKGLMASNVPLQEYKGKYTRLLRVNKDLILEILKQEIVGIKNIRLSSGQISPNSMFQLDSISLSRIYAELIYYPDHKGFLNITLNPDAAKFAYDENSKAFAFEKINFSLDIYINDNQKSLLAKTAFELAGKLKPVVYHSKDLRKEVFMRLSVSEIEVKNLNVEKGKWDNQFAVLNKAGTKSFLTSLISNYFLAFYRDEAIGNGLQVGTGIVNQRLEYIRGTNYDEIVLLDIN